MNQQIILELGQKRDERKKRFVCNLCSQSFSRAHNLKSHRLIHSDSRPYKCETCEHRFRRVHDLKRHQKLHTGERPFACKVCRRSFARMDALRRHHNAKNGGCHGSANVSITTNGDRADEVQEIKFKFQHPKMSISLLN